MSEKKVRLFIYGSLRDPKIFHSVSGLSFSRKPAKTGDQTLFAEPALLSGYRKVSPDKVYFYAVPSASSKIEGLVVHGIPDSAMAEIDRYEGRRYEREAVRVNTATGPVRTQAYLGCVESMKKHFRDRFHVNLIHELWLRKRINKFIQKKTRPGDKTLDAQIERLADKELLATTERDLVISHYGADAVSDYYLQHELDRPRPDIKHLYGDYRAERYIDNYLALVIKQVLLNRLDEQIQDRYRFELEHLRTSERYFKRSISLLTALQIINENAPTVKLLLQKALQSIPYEKHGLIDYVKYAVRAAKNLFDPRIVEDHLDHIRANLHPGLVPLGCEIEFSNLGVDAVQPQPAVQEKTDPVYDGFRYFHDFQLDVLCWKLGGYIDDHTGSTGNERRTGFLEFAPGRLNISGELSRPATADPWLLNQLIYEITEFYDVKPHSLHLSFQLRKNQVNKQRTLPLGFVKCLLALGGGPEVKVTGVRVSRLGHHEIIRNEFGEEMVFARTSERKWYLGKDEIADKTPVQATTLVHQYKFIRLDKRANYEPLIMCLKGLQLAYNPGDYLTAAQLKASKRLSADYEQLKKWADAPFRISPHAISTFLNVVRRGLMNEGHHQPVHSLHYIDWAISSVNVLLRMFNEQLSHRS